MTPNSKMDRSSLNPDPIAQFKKWFEEAKQAGIKNPDAMTLATASREGVPTARIVLYKGTIRNQICFFTNYESRKGETLLANPKASLVFYWSLLDRQIGIEGTVEKLSAKDSDEYWLTRPRESRLSALASLQSQVIPNRDFLENRLTELTRQYEGKEIPRPEHWGGFALNPNRMEFWTAGDFRLHDRFCYSKKDHTWELVRLSP